MSNELNTPKVLVCPADTERSAATNFGRDLINGRISYFVGVDATQTNPQSLLSGDRNLTNGVRVGNGFVVFTTNELAEWTEEIHRRQGNAGLADGSVQQLTTMRLRDQIAHSGLATNRLAMP
jgi:hypothetical protein